MAASSPLHIQQSLKNLGFTSNEASVLVLLLQIKKGTAKEISQKTAISLSGVQFCMSNLTRKKLVRSLPGKEDYYEVCSEQEFQRWIDEQKEAHDDIYKKAGEDLEGFFDYVGENSWQPTILYYEGEEGIKEIYENMLEEETEAIYCWTDSSTMYDLLKDYIPSWVERRLKKGVKSYAIMPDNEQNQKYASADARDCRLANFDFSGQIRIYSDKAAIMTFAEDKPVGIVLKGELFARLFKSIFDLCWKENS